MSDHMNLEICLKYDVTPQRLSGRRRLFYAPMINYITQIRNPSTSYDNICGRIIWISFLHNKKKENPKTTKNLRTFLKIY